MGRLIAAAAGALVGAAVAKELDKPSEQREWHGEVGGVPYDFRRPSVDKLRRSAWDPDNPDVIVPHAFGVGWSVNFARVADRAAQWIQPPPAAESTPAAPVLAAVPAAPALPPAEAAADGPVAAPAVPPVVPPVAAPAAPPAPPPVVLPAVDTPATPVVDTPATPAVGTPATPGMATPATPAAAADTPATPAGPPDATGDSQG